MSGQRRLVRRFYVLREIGLLSRLELLNHLRFHAALGEEHLAALFGILDREHVLTALAGRRDLGAEGRISRSGLMMGAGRHEASIALRRASV